MFKSFNSFNQKLDSIVQSADSVAIAQAIETSGSIQSALSTISSRYTRAYNSVQVIKYDENGDPIDVTPPEQLTVPANVLKFAQSLISSFRNRLSTYRDRFATVQHQLSVNSGDFAVSCLLGVENMSVSKFQSMDTTLILYSGFLTDGSIYDSSSSGDVYFSFIARGSLPDKVYKKSTEEISVWADATGAWIVRRSVTTGLTMNSQFYYYPGSGLSVYSRTSSATVNFSSAGPSFSVSATSEVTTDEGITPEAFISSQWTGYTLQANPYVENGAGVFVPPASSGDTPDMTSAGTTATMVSPQLVQVPSTFSVSYESADLHFDDLVVSDQELEDLSETLEVN